MKKLVTLSLVALSITTLSGCAGKIKGGAERKITNGQKEDRIYIEGEITFSAKLLRDARNLIASASGFTFEEWNLLDPSDYSLEIDNSFGSYTTINNNAAMVTVFSYGAEVGSKSFPLARAGNTLKFSEPNSVKNWSQQFIDIGDKIAIEVHTTTSNLAPSDASVSAKWKEGLQILETVNYSVESCPPEFFPTPTKPFCGPND